MFRTTILTAAALMAILAAAPASADALGEFIQVRTANFGENCTRYKEHAVCLIGNDSGYTSTYAVDETEYARKRPSAPSPKLCTKFQPPGLKLFAATFVKYEGEVLLRCTHYRVGSK